MSTKAPERTGTMDEYEITMTSRRARIAAQNMASRFCGMIEVAADSIIRTSDDPTVQVAAIEWKASAIPALQHAAYQPDPLVSLADGWAFMVQMTDYLETGRGATRFGAQQPIALNMARDAEAFIQSTAEARLSANDVERIRSFVYRWAEANPIDNDLFIRISVGESAADVLAGDRPEGFGQLGTLTEFASDAQQMSLMLATYIPKEVRWQSELLIDSMMDAQKISPVLASVDSMAVLLALTHLLEQTPELIAEERAALFREVSEERLAILENLERQRQATLEAAVELINSERAMTLNQVATIVAAERDALTKTLEENRDTILKDTRGLIDHIVLRVLEVLALFGVVIVGAALVLRRRVRA